MFAYDRSTFAERSSVELDDLRWVDVGGDYVVALQGTPGRLSVLDPKTFDILATWPFPGADVAESKSTVVVHGGKAFVAAGTAGVPVLSLATGEVVGSLPVPEVEGVERAGQDGQRRVRQLRATGQAAVRCVRIRQPRRIPGPVSDHRRRARRSEDRARGQLTVVAESTCRRIDLHR